ncbi:hypothetical protein O6H91_07G062800 [Diphasiastrum complanatum]|nr:hypothetical protein O6H91_07G062800 [Diphasiastrum complanatum]
MKYLWGTHMRVGSLFMKLKSILSRYLKFGPAITSNLKLKHTRGKQHYQRLGSDEHVKSRRQQTFTLGKRRARLGSLRRFRVRLRCLSPIPLLKRLIDASVKISLAASEKGYPGGLVMPHQLSFPISPPVGQVHY